MYRERGNHIITQVTEHKAVLDTCKKLEKQGYRVTYLPVQADGLIDIEDLSAAPSTTRPSSSPSCTRTTRSASSSPFARSASSATRRACSSTPTPSRPSARSRSTCIDDNIDVLILSGHKIYGPKGVGALYVRRRNPRVRSPSRSTAAATSAACARGTLNVPGIVGLGKACEICGEEMAAEAKREVELRDYLQATSSKPRSTTRRSTATWSTTCPATST